MISTARIEIIAVGRELLTGRTPDKNSNWVAKKITAFGGQIQRITCVDDNLDGIANEIRAARRRKSHVVITTGGLGPTDDDMTLGAAAKAFNVSLEVNQAAAEFVRSRYKTFYDKGYVDSPRMTPSRRKMAKVPKGSKWLSNGVGAAPAVLMEQRNITLFFLPGVPREMKAVFDEHVVPYLKGVIKTSVRIEEKVVTNFRDESKLRGVLKKVMGETPGVYLKSTPSRFGKGVRIGVFITASGRDKNDAKDLVKSAKRKLLAETEAK